VPILRTPDDRFEHLPGYGFEPHYVEVDGLRIHYVDEGSGPVVLLMHGEPTWSYLYRKMIPILVDAGLRPVAPDLVGFGRSDKPGDRTEYTYAGHVAWMHGFLRVLDLRDVTLFGQDWGGLIGLRLVGEDPDRFAGVVASNTGLPNGDGPMSEAFMRWREFSQTTPTFPVGNIVAGGCATAKLSAEEIAAYDAPFPDESFKEGARQFPLLVPTTPDDPAAPANRAAWETLSTWERPFLTAFSDQDAVTRGNDAHLQARIPGANGQPHTTIVGAGHFLQEDKGEELAQVVVDFVERTS
jgi:haloalkane dehalogenase